MAESFSQEVSETPINIVSELSLAASTSYVVQNRTFRTIFLYEDSNAPANPATAAGTFSFENEEYLQIDVDSASTPVWVWTSYGTGNVSVLEKS